MLYSNLVHSFIYTILIFVSFSAKSFLLETQSNQTTTQTKAKIEDLRLDSLKRAELWEKPNWYTDELLFNSDNYDYYETLKSDFAKKIEIEPELYCHYSKHIQVINKADSTGKTRKFYCQIRKPNKPLKLAKIKYQLSKGENREIYAELAGTALLNTLGFSTDRVLFIPKVTCRNCSNDPWFKLDENKHFYQNFYSSITEEKIKGSSISSPTKTGWTFPEVKKQFTSETQEKETSDKVTQLDALTLLASVLQHTDNKNSNHRLICLKKLDSQKKCPTDAKVKALIHDLGATFGTGKEKDYIPGISPRVQTRKMYLKGWAETKVWKDPVHCIANQFFSNSNEPDNLYPQISESGRLFLSRLLNSFSVGPEGFSRLERLFSEAQVHELNDSAKDWALALKRKIEIIDNPLCEIDSTQCGKKFEGCKETL